MSTNVIVLLMWSQHKLFVADVEQESIQLEVTALTLFEFTLVALPTNVS